jgi:putative membrane protein
MNGYDDGPEFDAAAENNAVNAAPLPLLLPRAVLGGVLMGLANLVPGVSGGTMLLAAGVYTVFIAAVADITALRLRLRSLLVVGAVALSAAVGILLLAGPIKSLVVQHRWMAYSLFIGLTLGGVPVIWRMIGAASGSVVRGAAAGFAGMAVLAWFQQYGGAGGLASGGSWPMLVLAGLAGASAMILPGISGGYLLLVLGQYIPILSAVDTLKQAIRTGDTAAAGHIGITVILPVAVGLVIGVAGVSNLLKWLLSRYRQATLGVLLGLLLGAVVGLWPFQEGVKPEPGDVVQGQPVTAADIGEMPPEDYPTRFFAPSPMQSGGALLLIAGGFAVTYAVSLLERRKGKQSRPRKHSRPDTQSRPG